MNVLHYNIFNGFSGSEADINAFVGRLTEMDVDVLMLNEYQTASPLKTKLNRIGYPHVCVNERHSSGNRAAVFSRIPFDVVQCDSDDCRLVWVKINGVHLICYHASPWGVGSVLDELDRLQPLLRKAAPGLLCGDLNSLSEEDAEGLGYRTLEGTPGVSRYSREGRVSFEALRQFREMGFCDALPEGDRYTVPTRRKREHEQGAELRLDYVLCKDLDVLGLCVLREPVFAEISDHFPLRFTLPGDQKGSR